MPELSYKNNSLFQKPPNTKTLSKDHHLKLIKQRKDERSKQVKQHQKHPSWWTPVWRGLIADPEGKHRKRMSSAIWIYLYLLLYMNRTTGLVFRTQKIIASDTGFSLRAVQRHVSRLRRFDYIATEKHGSGLKIKIINWKSFKKINPIEKSPWLNSNTQSDQKLRRKKTLT